MFILVKTILGLAMPRGNFRWEGIDNEVLRRMLSRFRCRFQKSPLRSSSQSLASGRCKCVRFLPKRHAINTTPPKGESLDAPEEVIASASDCVFSGLLISKASSDEGRAVIMSLSSTVIGQPVP